MRSLATRALRQGPDPAMAEILQQCNGLAFPEHGNDLDLVTYDYCMAEMKLLLHEFDLISLKLVSKPDELTKLGFKPEHATAIVSAVHEHIAAEAGAEMATALARLRQADVEIDAELLAPRLRRRRRCERSSRRSRDAPRRWRSCATASVARWRLLNGSMGAVAAG